MTFTDVTKGFDCTYHQGEPTASEVPGVLTRLTNVNNHCPPQRTFM